MVETADAILVADKSRVQDVKKIVGRIREAHPGKIVATSTATIMISPLKRPAVAKTT